MKKNNIEVDAHDKDDETDIAKDKDDDDKMKGKR
jgi:hypothetical protein